MSRNLHRRPMILIAEDKAELLAVVARHLDQEGFEVTLKEVEAAVGGIVEHVRSALTGPA